MSQHFIDRFRLDFKVSELLEQGNDFLELLKILYLELVVLEADGMEFDQLLFKGRHRFHFLFKLKGQGHLHAQLLSLLLQSN